MPLTCSPVVLALLLLAQVVRAKNDCGTRACGSPSMAWGAKAGAADWCRRLQDNDKTLTSLLVMRSTGLRLHPELQPPVSGFQKPFSPYGFRTFAK